MSGPLARRLGRPVRTTAAVVAAIAVTFSLTLAGPALARSVARAVAPPPAHPTSDSQIQNIDQVKTAIKGYYGDIVTGDVDPVPNSIDGGDVLLHTFDTDGAYAKQVKGIVKDAKSFLQNPGDEGAPGPGAKAIVVDIDDTTLNTYSYEIYSNFVYNPTTNAAFVNACLTATCVFPAVPGMVSLVNYATNHGYTVFYLTGRPISQLVGTVANLRYAGYAAGDPATLFLKDPSAPWLASCGGASCTTTQYKSATRQHIESLGYNIVANFGDQFSDLNGGFADRTFKMPNPMYYLP